MTKHTIVAIAVAIFSAGWLLPLALSVSSYLSFWQSEGWPLLLGRPRVNSFPFLSFAHDAFLIAIAWLGVVILFWSYLGYSAWSRHRVRTGG